MSVNAAVSVHIIKFEIPAQLVLHLPSHHQTESGHVLHEVYVAVLQKNRNKKQCQTSINYYAKLFPAIQRDKSAPQLKEIPLISTLSEIKRARTEDYLQGPSEHRQRSQHQSVCLSDNLTV